MSLALKLHVLFGNSGAWFGVLWAGVLSLGLVSAFGNIEPRNGPTYDRIAQGRIVKVEKTDGDSDNDQHTVYAEYTDDQGGRHTVRSYASGARAVGEGVDVKYQHAHPDRAVIAGQRTHRYDVYFPLVIAAFGLFGGLMFWPSKHARLALRLLPRGTLAQGKVIELKEERDEGSTWTTRVEFTSLDNRVYQCEVESGATPPYMVGDLTQVLYDPGWPDRATPLAAHFGGPQITDDDRVVHTRDRRAYHAIAAALVVNAFLFVGCLVTVVLAVW